jgi:NAD-dependent deacetylase
MQLERWLGELAAKKGNLLLVTGAGISVASGIPVFRATDDPDAIWSASTMEMATLDFFLRDPVKSWLWYLGRFGGLEDRLPNPAHHAVAELERRWPGRFLLVTQNIDTLHEDAGSKQLVKVHGSSAQVRCSRNGCVNGAPLGTLPRRELRDAFARFLASPEEDTIPRCPGCGALLRPHVLWFDESYDEHASYGFAEVLAYLPAADAAIFVGTSFSVNITAIVTARLRVRGRPCVSIDPHPLEALPGVTAVKARAEELLPNLVASLRG